MHYSDVVSEDVTWIYELALNHSKNIHATTVDFPRGHRLESGRRAHRGLEFQTRLPLSDEALYFDQLLLAHPVFSGVTTILEGKDPYGLPIDSLAKDQVAPWLPRSAKNA